MRMQRRVAVAATALALCAVGGVGVAVASAGNGVATPAEHKQQVLDATHPWDFPGTTSVAKVKPAPAPRALAVPGDFDRVILKGESGIINGESVGTPLPGVAKGFLIDTQLHAAVGYTDITVLAGALEGAPDVPVVRVILYDGSTGSTSSRDFTQLQGTGPAHLESINGDVLSVRASGAALPFSLLTGSF